MMRKGRSAWVWSVVLYAAATAGAIFGLDYWHPSLATGGAVKLQRLRRLVQREPDRPLVVMLGSSRTDAMFMAGRLDGQPGPGGKPVLAYNMGVPAYAAMHHLLSLRDMLDAGIRPRLLLIEFLAPLMNEPKADWASEENWTAAIFLSRADFRLLRPYMAWYHDKLEEWTESRTVPFYTFRFYVHEAILNCLAPWSLPSWEDFRDSRGFKLPDYSGPAELARLSRAAYKQFHEGLGHYRLGKGVAQAMRDLLERCRRERLAVVLVVPPDSTTFRGWYCREGLAQAYSFLGELRRTYGVKVIDASTWLPDTDFRDGHHVNAAGARRFTTRLIEELRPILAELGEGGESERPGPVSLRGR
jgi:hypothetical protein